MGASPSMIRVRCSDGEASRTPPDRQDAAPRRRAGGRAWLAGGARCYSPGLKRRAACLHAQASGRGARSQPLNVPPACAALRRHGRDALGRQAHPGRRTRATAGRTATSRQAAPSAARSRSSAAPTRRGDRTNPNRAGRGREPAPDRSRAQCRRYPDSPRGQAVVALDDSVRPDPYCPG
jgi:hypothetical protein